MDFNKIHNGECIAWLKTLPDGIADAIITDPPYSSGGQDRSDRMQGTNTKYLNTENEGLYAGRMSTCFHRDSDGFGNREAGNGAVI